MKLVAFSVENFRSITKAHKIQLGQQTVLIGRNNEGKSNLLKALVAGLTVLSRGGIRYRTMHQQGGNTILGSRIRWRHANVYNWEHDFPIHLQDKKPDGKSTLKFDLELTPAELMDFQTEIKSKLNGTLPITVELGQDDCSVTVSKQGRGGAALTKKSDLIARFIGSRLIFDYVPAVRTAQRAQDIVERMIERELEAIESDPSYENALLQIEKLQTPVLQEISVNIRETLKQFLPEIKNVNVRVEQADRYRALRRTAEIYVDDGTLTLLKYKGDGVQSLAALGMMRL